MRKNWIDTARAIAMIFIVWGHIGNYLSTVGIGFDSIYSFVFFVVNPIKVPAFFAVSGYLFSAKNESLKYFAKREAYSRFIPYIVYGSIMGVIGSLMDIVRMGIDNKNIFTLLAERWIYPLAEGQLIWFIPCLIIVEILFFCLLKISGKRIWILSLLTIACTILGYVMSAYNVMNFWKINTAFTCVQFMTLGYLIRNVEDLEKRYVKNFSVIGYAVLLAGMNFIWKGCKVDVNTGAYFNPLAFSILSCVGVFALFAVSKTVKDIKPLLFVGRNTFTYFVWHMYVVQVIFMVIRYIPHITQMPMFLFSFLLTAVTCFLVGIGCIIINKYLWFTVGGRKQLLR